MNTLSRPMHITPIELLGLFGTGAVVGSAAPRAHPVVAFGAAVIVLWAWRWWRGRCALDQWPSPYGKYYNEWLSIKEPEASKAAGGYYPWLARKMGGVDPWRSWAERER